MIMGNAQSLIQGCNSLKFDLGQFLEQANQNFGAEKSKFGAGVVKKKNTSLSTTNSKFGAVLTGES